MLGSISWIPTDAKVGDHYDFEITVIDSCISETFTNLFEVIVDEPQDYSSGGSTREKTKRHNENGKNQSRGFAMPEIHPIYKNEWDLNNMNEQSALKYVPTDSGGDYFVNMDNKYLLIELSSIKDKNKMELIKSRFTYSMAIIAMSIIGYYKNRQEDDEDVDIEEQVAEITTMISPVLIPMIEAMADLDISGQVK